MSPKKEREAPSAAPGMDSDRPPRSSLACSHCRARKIRCTGGQPCKRCGELKKHCEYAKVTAEENIAARARKAAQAARRAAAAAAADGVSAPISPYDLPCLPLMPIAVGLPHPEPVPIDPATGKAARPRILKHASEPLAIPRAKRPRERKSAIPLNTAGHIRHSELPEGDVATPSVTGPVPPHLVDASFHVPGGFMNHVGDPNIASRKGAPPPLRLSTSVGSMQPQQRRDLVAEQVYPEPWSGISSLAPSPYLRARADSSVSVKPDSASAHSLDFATYGFHPGLESSGEDSPWLPPTTAVNGEAFLSSWLDHSGFPVDGSSPTINPAALSSSASSDPYWNDVKPVISGVTPTSAASPAFSMQSPQSAPAPGLQSSTGTTSSTESTPMLATPSPDEHGFYAGPPLPSVMHPHVTAPFVGSTVQLNSSSFAVPGGLMVDGLSFPPKHFDVNGLDSIVVSGAVHLPPASAPHYAPTSAPPRQIRHGSHASVSYPIDRASALVAEADRGASLKHARSWSASLQTGFNPTFSMADNRPPQFTVAPAQQPPRQEPSPPQVSQHQRQPTHPLAFHETMGSSPAAEGVGVIDDIGAGLFPGLAGSPFAEAAGGLTPGLVAAAGVPASRRPSLTLAGRSCTAPSGVTTLQHFSSTTSAHMMTNSSSSSPSVNASGRGAGKWQPHMDGMASEWPSFEPTENRPQSRHPHQPLQHVSHHPRQQQYHPHHPHPLRQSQTPMPVSMPLSFDATDAALAQQAQGMHLHSPFMATTTFGY